MNSLQGYFDTAYLINLPHRVDRLASARREFAKAGWTIDANGVRIFPAQKFSDRAGFPNTGVRGCFQSHLDCLRRAYAEQRRNVLLLEDDVGFAPTLSRLTSSVISQLNNVNWDFVYFGHYGADDIRDAGPNTNPGDVKLETWTAPILTTYFYGVSGRILVRLIERLERHASGIEGDHEWGPMPIDGAFNLFRRDNPDVLTLIANPRLGFQRPSRSDITPNKFDRIPLFRTLADLMRELKSTVSR